MLAAFPETPVFAVASELTDTATAEEVSTLQPFPF